MTTIRVGDITLSRVLYVDAAIDPDPTGLTPDEVRSVAWAEPQWAEGDQVRAAACAWVVQGGGRTLVVDPAGNIDDILHDPATTADHQQAFIDAFARAGIDVDVVDTVLLSHIESVGITAVRDAERSHGWRPFFPNSRIAISEQARRHFDDERGDDIVSEAFGALFADGLIDTFSDGDAILPRLRVEWTGAHNPGHVAFHVGDPVQASFVGHLAVTPLHLATGPCVQQHPDPQRAWDWLQSTAADGRQLIGPLWPSPGAGRWDGASFTGIDAAT